MQSDQHTFCLSSPPQIPLRSQTTVAKLPFSSYLTMANDSKACSDHEPAQTEDLPCLDPIISSVIGIGKGKNELDRVTFHWKTWKNKDEVVLCLAIEASR